MCHKFRMLEWIGDIKAVLCMFLDSKKSVAVGSCASPESDFGAQNHFCARAAGSVRHMVVQWGAGMVTRNHVLTTDQAWEYGGDRCFGQ